MRAQETEAVDELISRARKKSRRGMLFTINLAAFTSLVGIGVSIWSWHAVKIRRMTAEQLTQEQRKVSAAQLAEQKAHEREQMLGALLAAGAEQAHLGHYAAAGEEYDEALNIDPQNAAVLQLKGYLELRQGRTNIAIPLLKSAVSYNPEDPWGHYNLALALYRSGDAAGAAVQIQELIAIAPTFRRTILGDPQFSRARRNPEIRKIISGQTGE